MKDGSSPYPMEHSGLECRLAACQASVLMMHATILLVVIVIVVVIVVIDVIIDVVILQLFILIDVNQGHFVNPCFTLWLLTGLVPKIVP